MSSSTWSSFSLSRSLCPIHNNYFVSRSMFCNSYRFSILPICSPEELISIDSTQLVRSPICGVWGGLISDAVTKWHLMRGDDDHELEIVITRSHSLLCFLTASIQNLDYQSIFQCKLSGFNDRNTECVMGWE